MDSITTDPIDPIDPVETSTIQVTTQMPVNPIKPCLGSCKPCSNSFASKLIRATGDWSLDTGSATQWDAAEPKGLMTFEEQICR